MPSIGFPIDKEWAWGGATGAGIDVAVIDSGVDPTHPDVRSVERYVALSWDSERQDVDYRES
jgi:subtilisin family serine protease